MTILLACDIPVYSDTWMLADQLQFDQLQHGKHSTRTITPIFSQLVSFYLPEGFVPQFENAQGPNYIMEFVPQGETVKRWTQMITVTGGRDVVLEHPDLSPKKFSEFMATQFHTICPLTFNAEKLLEGTTSGRQTFGK